MCFQYGNKRHYCLVLLFCAIFIAYYVSCQKKGMVDPSESVRDNIEIISNIVTDKAELKIGGEIAQITAYIIDGQRKPVQNRAVYFYTKSGSITPLDSTDVNGIAHAEYMSGISAGYDTISVKLTNSEGTIVSDSISVRILYTTQLTLTLESKTLLADGESTTDISLLLKDGAGIPIPDKNIRLLTDFGTIDEEVTTDFKGEAYATYTTSSSEENRMVKIYALFAEDMGKKSATKIGLQKKVSGNEKFNTEKAIEFEKIHFSKNQHNDNNSAFQLRKYSGERADTVSINLLGVHLYLDMTPTSVEADGKNKISIIATLKTADDSLLSGKQINFSTSFGTLINTAVISDEHGEAKTEIISTNQPGQAIITATFGKEISEEAVVYFTEMTGIQVQLSANPASIQADGVSTSSITAILKNSSNNPIINSQIDFVTSLGNIPSAGITDNMGITQVDLMSERKNGVAEVIGSYNGINDTVKVLFEGIDLSVRANPKDVIANDITTSAITITLNDAAGNPIENEQVILTTSIGSLLYGAGYTDAKGEFVDSIDPLFRLMAEQQF